MTEAERIAEQCPTCHVVAGKRCVDPIGDETPRAHRTRGPGQLERHPQAALDRKEARDKASYGPLFQDLAASEVTKPTIAEAKLNARTAAARVFDAIRPTGVALCEQANKGMQWIWVWDILNEIGRRCGENWQEAIRANVLEGFGNGIEYVPSRLKTFLTTTEAYHFAYFRVPDETRKLGVRLEPALTWAPERPVMTVEEFDRRFPKPDHYRGVGKDAPEPDDGGLFERTIRAIAAARVAA